MALRVLLADESTTIKKVMQLALQDFAVEVKSVHTGVDVAEVARSFVPDIVFIDVLLQKKNGYEVCAELKRDPELKTIPVVLMWSSFMDLDEKQAALSNADRQLEKPFDVEHLRQLVMELVPKTRSQRLAHFLQYPESITEPLREEIAQKSPQTPPPLPPRGTTAASAATPPPPAAEAASSWNMDSFEDIKSYTEPPHEAEPDDEGEAEKFSEVRIVPPAMPQNAASSAGAQTANAVSLEMPAGEPTESGKPSDDDLEPWSHQDLSRFKLDLEPESAAAPESAEMGLEFTESEPPPMENTSGYEVGIAESEAAPGTEPPALEIELGELDPNVRFETEEVPEEEAPDIPVPPAKSPDLDENQLERIIRAQSREIIERLVRRIVPEIATQMIREELERLLEEPGPGGNPT